MALDLQFTTLFDLDSDSGTFGNFVFEDTTDYSAGGYDSADVIGFFTVVSPLGTYYTGSFDSPNTDGSIPNFTFDSLAVPTIATEQYLLGGYVFTYNVKIDGTDEFSTSVSYTLCPPTTIVSTLGEIQDACESHSVNTICNLIDITNTTNYGTYTTLTQSITLSPPALTSMPDVTTNSSTLEYRYYYVNVAYSIYINSLVTYVNPAGNVTVSVRVDLYFTISVSPAKLAAELMSCFVRFGEYFTAQAAFKGGINGLQSTNPALVADMVYVGFKINEFNAATQIGSWVIAENLIPQIEAVIGQWITCDCGCNTTIPRYVEPYCNCDGSGSGSNLSFTATYPVIQNGTGDVKNYALDPTFLASLEDITQVTIESSDESVSVGTAPDYDLSVKNSLAFTATFLYSAGNDLSVTVSNVIRQGTRYISGFPAAAADIQVINYPHGSVAALKAEYAVFLVKNFLTTPPGVEIPDKLDVSEIQILNAGASATDFSQSSLFRMELMGRTTTGFYFRLVDAVTGLPISMDNFISALTSLQCTFKINQ